MPSVLITRPVPQAGLAKLASAGIAVCKGWELLPQGPKPWHAELGRHDAVICQLVDRIDEPVLSAAAPRCKIFSTCAVGHDNFDLIAAARLGIVVTNTPEVLTEATADLTWALLMATARRLGEAERVLRAGAWKGWAMLEFLGADVFGATLGIVGAGRIGAAVARRAVGFSMKVLYCGIRANPELELHGAKRVELLDLLRTSDYVSLHVPLTRQTRHLINEEALAAMKPTAFLINVARGPIVDERALIRALREGWIAGAGLDVYEQEPRVPPELLAMENVVLLPHVGSATTRTRSRMAEIAAENVIAVLRGEPPLNPVRSGQ